MIQNKRTSRAIFKIVVYFVCILLAILSIFPFLTMFVNATRSTPQIQSHAVSLIPGSSLINNIHILLSKSFNPLVGFFNSLVISTGATVCAVYFSSLTAPFRCTAVPALRSAFCCFRSFAASLSRMMKNRTPERTAMMTNRIMLAAAARFF